MDQPSQPELPDVQSTQEGCNRMPALWLLRVNVDIAYKFDRSLLRDENLGVQNWEQLSAADDVLRIATKSLLADDVPPPDDFPAPRLALPGRGFAPDYFEFGIYTFCSRRLRDTLAQPEHIVQYTPVELVKGGTKAQAQDYRLMRVLSR